jgi:hypothetical protein
LCGDLRERNLFEGLGIDGSIIVKMDLQEVGWGETGLIWLMVGTGGGLL